MGDMPRVLVISNTALKRSNSNGLSILNVLSAIPVSNIASFYIQNTFPDRGVAATHFRLTDSEKMHGFLFGGRDGTIIDDSTIPACDETLDVQDPSVKGKESFFKHDVRDFVWKWGYWNRKKFYKWVEDFAPTVILFMNGRSPFMFDITRGLAKRFGLPVIYFTSEDEYWHPATNFWDRILRKKLRKATIKLNKYVKYVVAFHEKLGKMYEDEFHLPVTVIMPSSLLKPVEEVNEKGNWLYAGNLKPYRFESLLDIAQALQSVDPTKLVDVYSNDVDDEIRSYLSGCSNVILREPVGRDQLDDIRRRASALLHFESFSSRAKPLIQNAFSSKIADCLALGIPFFVYAPNYCGFSLYFEKNADAVCYISKKDGLEPAVKALVGDAKYRASLRSCAIELAGLSHNQIRNAEAMKGVLELVGSVSGKEENKNA